VVSAVGTAAAAASDLDPAAWAALESVRDPEIPAISIVELGIVRYVRNEADGSLRVGLSPTYSGCPATAMIRADVEQALHEAGFPLVRLEEVLSPPWSSDWISEAGHRKLRDYGIAPPAERVASIRELTRPKLVIECPRCHARASEKLSEFGSTPCKALYRCTACLEPFDYFKCI
jgi:ring-1,2-phenylacetyl-CoA epoxidase subunit PaaD